MNTTIRLRTLVFWGAFASLLAVAGAHHGNPQAPTPRWEGTLPGLPAPQSPALPGG
jgi:hypothetical protein